MKTITLFACVSIAASFCAAPAAGQESTEAEIGRKIKKNEMPCDIFRYVRCYEVKQAWSLHGDVDINIIVVYHWYGRIRIQW